MATDDIHDSDIDPSTGRTEVATVNSGEHLLDLDTGIYQTPSGIDEEQEPATAQDKQLFLPIVARKNFKDASMLQDTGARGERACIAP